MKPLFIFFASFAVSALFAQSSIEHVTTYDNRVYNSGYAVYSITTANDGTLFFATSGGVVAYDGSTWTPIQLDENRAAHTVAYDSVSNRIYVGGTNTLGFITKNGSGYQYISLMDRIKGNDKFGFCWQILFNNKEVLFQTYERFYSFKKDSIEILDISNSYMFIADEYTYVTTIGDTVSIYKDSSLVYKWKPEGLRNESLYWVHPLEKVHYLFFPTIGTFIHDLETNTVKKHASPLNTKLKDWSFYHAVALSDSVLAIGTWNNGLYIADLNGNEIAKLETGSGILSNLIYFIHLGPQGKLWIGTDYGISVWDIREGGIFDKDRSNPMTPRFNVVELDHAVKHYVEPGDTIHLNYRPESVELGFSIPGDDYFNQQPLQLEIMRYKSTLIDTLITSYHYHNISNGFYQFSVSDPSDPTRKSTFYMAIRQPWFHWLFENWEAIIITLLIVGSFAIGIIYIQNTTKKRLERLVHEKTRDLELANKNLSEINEELDNFIYRSSHDLIAPVKSVKGLLEIMKISKDNNPEYFKMLEGRILRLEQIISEINNYIKSSKKPVAHEEIELKGLVEDVFDDLEYYEEAHRVKFINNMPEGTFIDSDKERWKIILSNLLQNSIKYFDPGKESPFVAVTLSLDGDLLTLTVEDNGRGIPAKYQQKVFDIFFRASEGTEGTGLGLFLVKRMSAILGAEIQLTSNSQGTKVSLELPIHKVKFRQASLAE